MDKENENENTSNTSTNTTSKIIDSIFKPTGTILTETRNNGQTTMTRIDTFTKKED